MTTRTEGIGFSRDRKASEVEAKLNIETDPNQTVRSLEAMGNTFVEIFLEKGTVPGIYGGTTKDGANIVIPSTFPNGATYFNKDAKQNEKCVWRNQPTFSYETIHGFRPLDRQTLEAYGSGFEKVAGLGKFLEDSDSDQISDS